MLSLKKPPLLPQTYLLPITVTILIKNSEKYLFDVLSALSSFAEVLIYDTGSTDTSLQIAASFPNVRLLHGPLDGFGRTHNTASSKATYDWILSIDSDEVVTPSLVEEIFRTTLDPNAVYSVPRKNHFRGKWIKGCGWYPNRQVRLYHRKHTAFSEALVHESILTAGKKVVSFTSPLLHYPYDSISDFLRKMEMYSTLFAIQYHNKRRSSLSKALLHSLFAFIRSYLLQRGCLDGYEGFVISCYTSHTTFYKYLKLYEKNQEP